MDRSNQSPADGSETRASRSYRPRSVIFQRISRMTGRLYVVLAGSFIGRCVRGYRTLDDALGGKKRRSISCHSVSGRRHRFAESVKNSFLSRFLRGILLGLYELPARFYGLFAIFFSLLSPLAVWLFSLLSQQTFDSEDVNRFLRVLLKRMDKITLDKATEIVVVAILMLAGGICLLVTSASLRAAVSQSRIASAILYDYLCIFKNPDLPEKKKMSPRLVWGAIALAVGASVGTLFVSAYAIPLCFLVLGLFGMVMTYPETGALLTVAALPAVWLWPAVMTPLVVLILLTALSYGLKLLQFRRTLQLDILDIVGLLFFILTLVSGVGGILTKTGNAAATAKLLACMSVYFFLVHLLNTRVYIRRCLIGVGMTTVLVMLAGVFLKVEPIGILQMTGDDPIRKITETVEMSVFDRDSLHRSLLTVMTFPLLCAFLLRSKRLFTRVASLLLLGLNVYLIAASSSVGTIFCTLGVGVLLCLLMDHRSVAGAVLFLPAAIGAGGWYLTRLDLFSRETVERISREIYEREVRMAEFWQMVAQRPMGFGPGVACEGANLFFEVLVSLGWPGLIVSVLFLVLLLQKGTTALSHTVIFTDRALLVGLICGVVGFLLRGVTYGFLSEPRAILTLAILAGLLSVLANVLFRESDERDAEFLNSPTGVDRLYRRA